MSNSCILSHTTCKRSLGPAVMKIDNMSDGEGQPCILEPLVNLIFRSNESRGTKYTRFDSLFTHIDIFLYSHELKTNRLFLHQIALAHLNVCNSHTLNSHAYFLRIYLVEPRILLLHRNMSVPVVIHAIIVPFYLRFLR